MLLTASNIPMTEMIHLHHLRSLAVRAFMRVCVRACYDKEKHGCDCKDDEQKDCTPFLSYICFSSIFVPFFCCSFALFIYTLLLHDPFSLPSSLGSVFAVPVAHSLLFEGSFVKRREHTLTLPQPSPVSFLWTLEI